MYLTFLRTKIGLDEQPFIKYFQNSKNIFVNIDDTEYTNFNTNNLILRVLRKLLRGKLEHDLYKHTKKILETFDITDVFIFNGKGISKKTAKLLKKKSKKIYWYFPDFIRHRDFYHLEEISSKIFFPKPKEYNSQIFNSIYLHKINNIFPIFFSDNYEKKFFFNEFKTKKISYKKYKLGFLGNFSKFKYNCLVEISKLNKTKIAVVGYGWFDNDHIINIGPVYGSAIFNFFKTVKIGIAIIDSLKNEIDPLTLRYFQYSLNMCVPIMYVNNYNRQIFEEFKHLCFENFVEANDKIDQIDKLSLSKYQNEIVKFNTFLFKNLRSVEDILSL